MTEGKVEKILIGLREVLKANVKDRDNAIVTFRLITGGLSGDVDVTIKARDHAVRDRGGS